MAKLSWRAVLAMLGTGAGVVGLGYGRRGHSRRAHGDMKSTGSTTLPRRHDGPGMDGRVRHGMSNLHGDVQPHTGSGAPSRKFRWRAHDNRIRGSRISSLNYRGMCRHCTHMSARR